MYAGVEVKMTLSKIEINSFHGTSKIDIKTELDKTNILSTASCAGLLSSAREEMDILEWVQQRAIKVIKEYLLYAKRLFLCLASGREDLEVILSMYIHT